MNMKELAETAERERRYDEAELMRAHDALVRALTKELKDKPTFYLPAKLEALLLKAAG